MFLFLIASALCLCRKRAESASMLQFYNEIGEVHRVRMHFRGVHKLTCVKMTLLQITVLLIRVSIIKDFWTGNHLP